MVLYVGKKRTLPDVKMSLNRNSNARSRLPPCELSALEDPEASQTIKIISAAVGCMPELDNMTLLQKTVF